MRIKTNEINMGMAQKGTNTKTKNTKTRKAKTIRLCTWRYVQHTVQQGRQILALRNVTIMLQSGKYK